jgi:hypothetical protein
MEVKGAEKPQPVYGSFWTQRFALSTEKKKAVFNADNYAMFARVSRIATSPLPSGRD